MIASSYFSFISQTRIFTPQASIKKHWEQIDFLKLLIGNLQFALLTRDVNYVSHLLDKLQVHWFERLPIASISY